MKSSTNNTFEINELAKTLATRKPKNSWASTQGISRDSIQQGLPTATAERIRSNLRLTEQTFANGLGLSRNTYAKHKKARVLGSAESEKVFRYLRVQELAFNTFSTEEATAEWLSSHCIALGGVPSEVMLHEPGTTETIETLKRIQYGIFA